MLLKMLKYITGGKKRKAETAAANKRFLAAKEAEEKSKCPERYSPFDLCKCTHQRQLWVKNDPCCGTYGLIIRICCDCRKEVDRRRVEWLPEDLARKYADRGIIDYGTWEKHQWEGNLGALLEAAVGNVKYIADRAEGMQQR